MPRKVKTWNPAYVNLPDDSDDKRMMRVDPFRTIIIGDGHEHHPNSIDKGECPDCGAFICELCGSDQHSASEGHDLSHPRYWGF